MVQIVVVRRTQIGNHGPVMAGDDHAAAPRGLRLVHAVLDTETGRLDGVVQDRRVLVVTHSAEEDDAVGREHVLGTAGRVLGAAAGDQFRRIVVQEVFVDAVVGGLGEDGIVGLETVFLEEGGITCSLNVCKVELLVWLFGFMLLKGCV